MFYQKIDSVYQCRLSESLKILLEVIEEHPHVKDHVTTKLKLLLSHMILALQPIAVLRQLWATNKLRHLVHYQQQFRLTNTYGLLKKF